MILSSIFFEGNTADTKCEGVMLNKNKTHMLLVPRGAIRHQDDCKTLKFIYSHPG